MRNDIHSESPKFLSSTRARLIILCISAVPIFFLLMIWKGLPESVPVHFDLSGHADRFGSRDMLISSTILMSGINCLVSIFITIISARYQEPGRVDNGSRGTGLACSISTFLTLLNCMLIYASLKGSLPLSTSLPGVAIGVLYTILGIYMPSFRQNKIAGIRLRSTLADQEVWRRTNLFARKVWLAGGVLLIVVALFLNMIGSFIAIGVVTVMIIFAVVFYSNRISKMGE